MNVAERLVESRMDDRCRISRDPQAHTDDVLDEDTLQLVAPADDATLIYQDRCLVVSDTDRQSQVDERSGQDLHEDRILVRIPKSAPAVRLGDRTEILKADRVPHLVGRAFYVVSVGLGPASSRHLHCATRARTTEV